MIGYLCKSLRIISLVWPTRLIFLAMGEVLSFGFNLALLDPSDSRGNDTYCIVAIEDKKMGFISYCLSLSLYIMSSYLMRYYVLTLLGKSLAAARVFGLLVARGPALQLTYSSSAGPPALLLHKCCSSALKGTSLLLIAIARFPCARCC